MTMIQRIAEVLRRARVDGGWDDEVVAGKVLWGLRASFTEIASASDHDGGRDYLRRIDAALAEAEPAHSSSEIGHG